MLHLRRLTSVYSELNFSFRNSVLSGSLLAGSVRKFLRRLIPFAFQTMSLIGPERKSIDEADF